MNHRQIEAFRAVMITGTTTEAAMYLHTSQPAISRLIAQLQTSARIKLFELHKGRLVPTPEAKALFRVVEVSYIGLDKITEAVLNLRSNGAGRLCIASVPSLGMNVLPATIKRFLKTWPNASFSIQTVSSDLVKEGVATGRYDVGIVMGKIDSAGVLTEALACAHMVCVMGKDHEFSQKSFIDITDLEGEKLITLNQSDVTQLQLRRLLNKHAIHPRTIVETTYSATVCSMVLEGLGIGVANPLVASSFVERNLLVKPLEPKIPFDLSLILPTHYAPSQLIEDFMSGLRGHLQEIPGISLLKNPRRK